MPGRQVRRSHPSSMGQPLLVHYQLGVLAVGLWPKRADQRDAGVDRLGRAREKAELSSESCFPRAAGTHSTHAVPVLFILCTETGPSSSPHRTALGSIGGPCVALSGRQPASAVCCLAGSACGIPRSRLSSIRVPSLCRSYCQAVLSVAANLPPGGVREGPVASGTLS